MKNLSFFFSILCNFLFIKCSTGKSDKNPDYLIPFTKNLELNPVLKPSVSTRFYCPVRKDSVGWEEKDVFNPAAVEELQNAHPSFQYLTETYPLYANPFGILKKHFPALPVEWPAESPRGRREMRL
jgi:hypothetical protein